mmetsp:Transcript_55735/g.150304  ORF Transcript_55735/g.150304 Transcript_55735/m.150304 type:complete len:205 (-) Transcript_55735:245-859(-)
MGAWPGAAGAITATPVDDRRITGPARAAEGGQRGSHGSSSLVELGATVPLSIGENGISPKTTTAQLGSLRGEGAGAAWRSVSTCTDRPAGYKGTIRYTDLPIAGMQAKEISDPAPLRNVHSRRSVPARIRNDSGSLRIQKPATNATMPPGVLRRSSRAPLRGTPYHAVQLGNDTVLNEPHNFLLLPHQYQQIQVPRVSHEPCHT